jgi:hypothetical protein
MSGYSPFLKRVIYPFLLILFCLMTNSLAANAMTNANIIADNNVLTPGVNCGDANQAQSAICTTSQNPDPIYGDNGIFEKITFPS